MTKNLKWILLAGGAGAVLYFVMKGKKKVTPIAPVAAEPASIDFTAQAFRWEKVYDRGRGEWIDRCVDSAGNIVAVRHCSPLHTL